jgi:hypothetical protein
MAIGAAVNLSLDTIRSKAPFEAWVIERAERPTEN